VAQFVPWGVRAGRAGATGVLAEVGQVFWQFVNSYHGGNYGVETEGLSRLPGAEPAQISIGDAFPIEVAQSARKCLRNPTLQRGYFEWLERDRTLNFAIQALGEWGDPTDIALLRAWSILPSTAQQAFKSIRQLEETEILRQRA
jgi:hypothetical protein